MDSDTSKRITFVRFAALVLAIIGLLAVVYVQSDKDAAKSADNKSTTSESQSADESADKNRSDNQPGTKQQTGAETEKPAAETGAGQEPAAEAKEQAAGGGTVQSDSKASGNSANSQSTAPVAEDKKAEQPQGVPAGQVAAGAADAGFGPAPRQSQQDLAMAAGIAALAMSAFIVIYSRRVRN